MSLFSVSPLVRLTACRCDRCPRAYDPLSLSLCLLCDLGQVLRLSEPQLSSLQKGVAVNME